MENFSQGTYDTKTVMEIGQRYPEIADFVELEAQLAALGEVIKKANVHLDELIEEKRNVTDNPTEESRITADIESFRKEREQYVDTGHEIILEQDNFFRRTEGDAEKARQILDFQKEMDALKKSGAQESN